MDSSGGELIHREQLAHGASFQPPQGLNWGLAVAVTVGTIGTLVGLGGGVEVSVGIGVQVGVIVGIEVSVDVAIYLLMSDVTSAVGETIGTA